MSIAKNASLWSWYSKLTMSVTDTRISIQLWMRPCHLFGICWISGAKCKPCKQIFVKIRNNHVIDFTKIIQFFSNVENTLNLKVVVVIYLFSSKSVGFTKVSVKNIVDFYFITLFFTKSDFTKIQLEIPLSFFPPILHMIYTLFRHFLGRRWHVVNPGQKF